jgi:L,D-peptidoglycan transpeptidase YkuD (ErfK/YbiS/YcfS/YnhG family)
MITRRTVVAVLASPPLPTGCGAGATGRGGAAGPAPAAAPLSRTAAQPARPLIRGLGPRRSAAIPEDCRQAVVVTGRGESSPLCTVVLHERTAAGWRAGPAWPAHNALHGWSTRHLGGDLHSPAGVYTLSDAGGPLPAPGSRLPYHHSRGFRSPGTGFEGESLAGCFDYVVAIDYNREPGTSPLDWTRPLGARRGGGIWFHVDHGGPTHGCVSIAKAHVKQLLLTLDPHAHPVAVMGHADWLAG